MVMSLSARGERGKSALARAPVSLPRPSQIDRSHVNNQQIQPPHLCSLWDNLYAHNLSQGILRPNELLRTMSL
jgi:hypothetical protein